MSDDGRRYTDEECEALGHEAFCRILDMEKALPEDLVAVAAARPKARELEERICGHMGAVLNHPDLVKAVQEMTPLEAAVWAFDHAWRHTREVFAIPEGEE